MTTIQLEHDCVRRIRARYDRIQPTAFSRTFFECLFEAIPEVRDMMPADLEAHGEFVEAAVAVVIRNLGDLQALEKPLEDLGSEHANRRIGPDQLALAGPVLVETMRRLSGDAWSLRDEQDWTTAFRALLAPMIRGAARGMGGR